MTAPVSPSFISNLPEKKPDFGILLAPDVHNPEGDSMIVDETAVTQENGGHFDYHLFSRAPSGLIHQWWNGSAWASEPVLG